MRILIADDDPVYRTLLGDLLVQWGFDVVLTCDGQEASEAIQADPDIDLAVLDWMMPGKDGYELCREIKQDPARQDLYIIIITGSRCRDQLLKVVVAGADDYILKPFEPLDLKIRLHAAKRIIDLRAELAQLRRSAEQRTGAGAH